MLMMTKELTWIGMDLFYVKPPVMASSNPPAFRLHYATLQRHFSKLPYLDIYLYERSDAGSDTPAETADKEVRRVEGLSIDRSVEVVLINVIPIRRWKRYRA